MEDKFLRDEMKAIRFSLVLIVCCLLLILVQSCSHSSLQINKLSPSAYVFHKSSLILQVNQEVLSTNSVLNNRLVQNYINSVGQSLVLNSGRSDISYRFIVLEDLDINAFAAPGGYIYITTGMLRFLKNEAQLAAVLAHEVGHISANHHLQLSLTELGLGLTFDYLGRIIGYDSSEFIPQLTQRVILQRFSQREEIQADEIGARIMSQTGYSPLGLIQLLQSMESIEQGGFLANFLASHPSSQSRINYVEQYIVKNKLNRSGLVVDRPIFHQVISYL